MLGTDCPINRSLLRVQGPDHCIGQFDAARHAEPETPDRANSRQTKPTRTDNAGKAFRVQTFVADCAEATKFREPSGQIVTNGLHKLDWNSHLSKKTNMFGIARETEFDLRFPLFGIPVRVHPIFWLTSAIIAWEPHRPDLTAIGVLVVFISILAHEFGHAFFSRRFGFASEIVLFIFGGYATVTQRTTWKNIVTLAAGPLAGLALAALTFLFSWIISTQGLVANWPDVWVVRLGHAINLSLFANIVWSLFNLFPVMPLDGGQLCREICMWLSPRKGMKTAIIIGLVCAVVLCLYSLQCWQQGRPMFPVNGRGIGARLPAFYFGFMAYQNFQALQNLRGGWR